MGFTLSREQQDIQRAAREFALGEFPDRAQEFDRNETFDLDLWRKACELGFVGMFIAEEYGGAGLGYLEHSLVTEEFWAVDAGMANAVLTTTFGAELLGLYGTEEQKQTYLPPLVGGKAIMDHGLHLFGLGIHLLGRAGRLLGIGRVLLGDLVHVRYGHVPGDCVAGNARR